MSYAGEDSGVQGRLGDYDVLHEISRGGMGAVLLARKRAAGGFDKLVAIKTIRRDLKQRDQLRAMFLDEAKLLSRLTHSGLAQVHDFGEQQGTLYLVMEYVAGVSFRDLIDRGLPPLVAARCVAAACRGLHAAHELTDVSGQPLGVVHRDVSPDNLMLTYDGQVKVLDFGIALMRGRQAPVTEFGTVKGKPPYLSPEQVRADALDRRTDIFAASVVLHEMLTGEPLFTGDSVYAVARAIQEHEVPAPSSQVGGVPVALDAVVLRGLNRDADARFQTASELADALDAVVGAGNSPSLPAFAADELAGPRSEHASWLRALLSTGAGDERVGRPTGAQTAVGDVGEVSSEGGVAIADTEPSDEPSLGAGSGTHGPDRAPEQTRASNRRLVWPIVALLLAVGGAVWWFGSNGREGHSTDLDAGMAAAAAPDPVDAGVDATRRHGTSPPDAVVVVDAAVPAVLDAGPAVVDARRRRPSKLDAGRHVRRDAALPRPMDAGAITQEPAEFGYLTIDAKPWANVRINGASAGPTPVLKHRLKVGSYTIEFIDPATNEVRVTKRVEIETGKTTRFVAR